MSSSDEPEEFEEDIDAPELEGEYGSEADDNPKISFDGIGDLGNDAEDISDETETVNGEPLEAALEAAREADDTFEAVSEIEAKLGRELDYDELELVHESPFDDLEFDFDHDGDDESVDVESLSLDEDIDKRITARLYGDTDRRTTPLQWLIAAKRPGEELDVHVRVLSIDERNGFAENGLTVLAADRTAATHLEVPGRLEDLFDDVQPGDEVVVTNLTTTPGRSIPDRYLDVDLGLDTDVNVVESPDRGPGEFVNVAGKVANAAASYNWTEKPTARQNVIQTLLNDHDIVTDAKADDKMWLYDDDRGIWVPDAAGMLKSELAEHLPDEVNTRREKNEIIDGVMDRTRRRDEPFALGPPEDPDERWLVPVQNGVVDLRADPSDALLEHDPEYYMTEQELLQVEYDADAECPEIDANMETIAGGDESMKATLYEIIALALFRHNDFRQGIFKIGPAKAGKSFTDKLLKWLVGEDSAPNAPLEKLVEGGFETAALEGTYAIIDDDAGSKAISVDQAKWWKRYLGVGGIRTAGKYDKQQSHEPYATPIANLNNPPVWKLWDEAIQSRILPVFFTEQFLTEQDGYDPSNPHHHKSIADSTLEKRLKTDEELSGLLNRVIEAAGKLHDDRSFSIEDEHGRDALLKKYNSYADDTHRFLREYTKQVDEPVVMRKADVMEVYRRVCHNEGIDPQGESKFWEQVRNDPSRYVEFGRKNSGERTVKYLTFSPKGFELAPAPIKNRYQNHLSGRPGENSTDSPEPLETLNAGYATVRGTVEAKTSITVRGDTKPIVILTGEESGEVNITWNPARDDVTEAFDDVQAGDKLTVWNGHAEWFAGELEVRYVEGYTELDIVRPRQEGLPDDEDDGEAGDASEPVNDENEPVESDAEPEQADDEQAGEEAETETVADGGTATESLPRPVESHIDRNPDASPARVLGQFVGILDVEEDRDAVEAALEAARDGSEAENDDEAGDDEEAVPKKWKGAPGVPRDEFESTVKREITELQGNVYRNGALIGPVAYKVELSTGVSKQTVRSVIDDMVEDGVVVRHDDGSLTVAEEVI